MRRVTCDEYPALAISVGKAEPQVPEAYIFEINVNLGTDRLFKEGVEVEIVACRAIWHRRMEKPVAVQIYPAKELPVPFQVRIDGVENRLVAID